MKINITIICKFLVVACILYLGLKGATEDIKVMFYSAGTFAFLKYVADE